MRILALLFFLLLSISCQSSTKPKTLQIDSTSYALRQQAMKAAMEFKKDRSNFRKAIELLDSAIKISPDFYSAYSNKANFHLLLGQKQEALQSIDSMLRIKPESNMAMIAKGTIYERMEKLDSAKSYYLKATKRLEVLYKDSANVNTFSNYVVSLKLAYDNQTALKVFYEDKKKFKDENFDAPAWINFEKILKTPRDQYLNNTKGPYASSILIR